MAAIRLKLPRPHVNQQAVLESPARYKVMACGRRWGKTTLGEIWVADPALHGMPCAWFAPTYKMLADVWRDLKTMYAPVIKEKSETEHRLEMITGGVIDMWSLDNPDAGRGRKYKRAFIDEGGFVPKLEEAWTQSIRPTLTDMLGEAMFGGTPKGRNYFWRLHCVGVDAEQPDWQSWQMPTTANPYMDPAEVEAARQQLPERAYKQEYLAEFIEDSGGVFRGVYEVVDVGRSEPEPPGAGCYTMGVDLARVEDFTVISVLDQNNRQIYFERFNQVSWELQIARIVAVGKRYNALVYVDSTGVGDPIFEQLRKAGLNVRGYQFTSASKERLIDNLSIAIEHQRLRLMDVPEQTNELLAYEYEVTASGNVRMNAPQGMHDDTVIALALAAQNIDASPVTGQSIITTGTRREGYGL